MKISFVTSLALMVTVTATATAGASTPPPSAQLDDLTAEHAAYAEAFGVALADVPAELAVDEALGQATAPFEDLPGVAHIEVVRSASPTVVVSLVEGTPVPTLPDVPGVAYDVSADASYELEELYDLAFSATTLLEASGITAAADVTQADLVNVYVADADVVAAGLLLDGPYAVTGEPNAPSLEETSYGGGRIYVDNTDNKTSQKCTTGFAGTRKGLRVLVTAGHCIQGTKGSGVYRVAWTSNYHWFTAGYEQRSKWGDWAIVYSKSSPATGRFYVSGSGSRLQDNKSYSVKGNRLCVYGRSTDKAKCGDVVALGYSMSGAGRLLRINGKIATHGDSGGPAWKSMDNPTGIIMGTTWKAAWGTDTVLSDIRYVDEALAVSLYS